MSTFWTCLRLSCGAINDRQSCSVCGGECVPGEWVPAAGRDAIREAARRLLGAHQGDEDLVPYLNALEDACGFWQQGDPPRRREPSDA
jgi:hypothetical protein